MKLRFIAVALFSAAFSFAYGSNAPSAAHAQTSGSAYAQASGDNNTYTSNYFDVTIKLPPSWVMASKAEADEILNVGSEMVTGDDKTMKDQMDASMAQSLPIMFASKYAMSAQRPDNINISSIAENVAAFPWITSGTQYFDNMKKIAAQSATPISFEDGYSETLIGGHAFTTMSASITLGAVNISQEYYATRRGDHIVSMITTYLTEDDKFLLDGIVSNIELDWE